MEFTDDGRAELVGNLSLLQQFDRLFDAAYERCAASGGHGIFLPAVLDVHGNIVHKLPVDEILQHVRSAAVMIKFGQKTHLLDLLQKPVDPGLQQRFPAGYGNSVQYPLPFGKELEEFLLRHELFLRNVKNKTGVVTEGAPEVASSCKYRTCHFLGKVQQCQFLKSSDMHVSLLFSVHKTNHRQNRLSSYYNILWSNTMF